MKTATRLIAATVILSELFSTIKSKSLAVTQLRLISAILTSTLLLACSKHPENSSSPPEDTYCRKYKVGDEYVYNIEDTRPGQTPIKSEFIESVGDPEIIKGKIYFNHFWQDGQSVVDNTTLSYVRADDKGAFLILGHDLTRTEICILKLPIKLGETWTENFLGVSGQIKIDSIEPLELPDGRVVNCLKTSFVSKFETCYNYHAPGLGFVKSSSVRKDGTKRECSLKRIRNSLEKEDATTNLAIMDDESKSSFEKILFTEPKSRETIRLISATQCEVANKDAIILADYSIEKDAVEGNKLRIVTRVGGNDTVGYLAIRPAGLISLKDRKVFLFAAILNKLRKTCPMDAYAECLESDFDRFYAALGDYKLNLMNYPSSHQGLNALLERYQVGPNHQTWNRMTKIPFDPWGSPYRYHFPGKKQAEPEIISSGPDRKECTADDISSQDISINIEATRKGFYPPIMMQEKIVGFWELVGHNWQMVAHFENNGKVTLTQKVSRNQDDEFQPEPVSGTYTIEDGPYTNLSPGLFGQVAKLKLHSTNQLNHSGGFWHPGNELIVLLDLIDNSLARVIPVLPERVDAMERLRYDDQKSYLWRRIEKN